MYGAGAVQERSNLQRGIFYDSNDEIRGTFSRLCNKKIYDEVKKKKEETFARINSVLN